MNSPISKDFDQLLAIHADELSSTEAQKITGGLAERPASRYVVGGAGWRRASSSKGTLLDAIRPHALTLAWGLNAVGSLFE